MSLQPVKKAQIMVPDNQGIMRPRQVRVDTAKFINSIVDKEEQMDAMTQSLNVQARTAPIPSPTQSTSSVASAGSATSATSGFSGLFQSTEPGQSQR